MGQHGAMAQGEPQGSNRSLGGEQRQRHTQRLELAWVHMWDTPKDVQWYYREGPWNRAKGPGDRQAEAFSQQCHHSSFLSGVHRLVRPGGYLDDLCLINYMCTRKSLEKQTSKYEQRLSPGRWMNAFYFPLFWCLCIF